MAEAPSPLQSERDSGTSLPPIFGESHVTLDPVTQIATGTVGDGAATVSSGDGSAVQPSAGSSTASANQDDRDLGGTADADQPERLDPLGRTETIDPFTRAQLDRQLETLPPDQRESLERILASAGRSESLLNQGQADGIAPGAVLQVNAGMKPGLAGGHRYVNRNVHSRRASGTAPSAERFVTLASAINDDPWSTSVTDQLGVAPDAVAFARLAALKSFSPPMAVGIFGKWGSGKSFFMRLIHDHVERLSSGKPSHEAPEADAEVFHKNIVQIRFNAWHYVETNLWASLVDHLFTQLAVHIDGDKDETQLLDTLGTARALTIEAAEELAAKRKERDRAQEALRAAEKRFSVAQSKVASEPALFLGALKEAIKADPQAKKLVTDASIQLGIPELAVEVDAAADAWEGLDRQLNRGNLLAGSLAKQFGSWWIAVAGILLLLPFAASWLLGIAQEWLPSLREVPAYVAALGATLGGAAALLGSATKVARSALDSLQKGKDAIDRAAQAQLKAKRAEVADEAAKAEAAKLSVDQARVEFDLASERLARAMEEFHGSTGGERLIRFIRTRASDGTYAAHLGLIASVRRDLEELTRGLDAGSRPPESATEQRSREALQERVDKLIASMGLEEDEIAKLRAGMAPRQAVSPPFQRLVLYIDDLDRCPSEQVVQVLQAVHMLLAFRLFVVFVAVDVRWVSHALEKHHPGLISSEGSGPALAAPTDYLEKIFQIPYWVRDAVGNSRKLIESLLPPLSAAADSPAPSQAPTQPTASDAEAGRLAKKYLEVSAEERQFFERIVPYVASTPRKVLWLVNVYRLLKAHDEYAADLQSPDACMALISQLVLASRDPEGFNDWCDFLQGCEPDGNVDGIVSEFGTQEREQERKGRDRRFESLLQLSLTKLGTDDLISVGQPIVMKYAELARRYSFATVPHNPLTRP